MTENTKGYVVHNVLFWLNNPESKEDVDQMVTGLYSLKTIEGMRDIHVGVPLDATKADNTEASYSVGVLMVFENEAALKAYGPHPAHLKFIEACRHLWNRAFVIDSINVT